MPLIIKVYAKLEDVTGPGWCSNRLATSRADADSRQVKATENRVMFTKK